VDGRRLGRHADDLFQDDFWQACRAAVGSPPSSAVSPRLSDRFSSSRGGPSIQRPDAKARNLNAPH